MFWATQLTVLNGEDFQVIRTKLKQSV